MPDFKLKFVSGSEIGRYIDDIANLRIRVFKEYPYLYDGDKEYERKYLSRYISSPDAMLVVALNENDEVIGAATGNGALNEMDGVKEPLQKAGYQLGQVYYLAELMIYNEYRGKGIGSQFLEMMEEKLEENTGLKYISLCTVVRDEKHRPENYHSPDSLWIKHGFVKTPEIVSHFSWKDVNDNEETEKPLVHWIKKI